ncbi:MAG: 16S rRNA (cytidine(1402)-2'-O)-methyltransferase [Candidatus Kapaibacteriales bacterium]
MKVNIVNRQKGTGTLFLVPTPIGNLKDVTLRSLEVLRQVDHIASEDTRIAGKLLKLLQIPPKELISYYDQEEDSKSDLLLQLLKNGKNIALISDAGTPLISDPGFKIVSKCIAEGIRIVPLPGPNAFIPALVASGLPINQFTFLGFPPNKKGYANFLNKIVENYLTTAIYVSPYKIRKLISSLSDIIDNKRKVCIAREISKMNESFYYGTILDIKHMLDSNKIPLKGEFVIVIEGKKEK